MGSQSAILGCLLGTAAGDSIGLPREGLSRIRGSALFGEPPLSQQLLLGRGFCSDDTEHTILTLLAIHEAKGSTARFEQRLASSFRWWLVRLPAGIGFATLRACVKLWLGISSRRSGVWSAGAGPAMRSAIIGVCLEDDAVIREHVHIASRITHRDPRAECGALCVAIAAKISAQHGGQIDDPAKVPIRIIDHVDHLLEDELKGHLLTASRMLESGASPTDFAAAIGQARGVSGYVNHVVPVALYCWLASPGDFRTVVESSVCCGGDTDTVAAIAGGVAGAGTGSTSIPSEWLDSLAEWPCGVAWMAGVVTQPTRLPWVRLLIRNLLFIPLVLAYGFRRIAPPYK
ncbi:MAG: ADP-ribosylglycohydrolase family protein [Planctomycetota bacterium]